MPSSAETRILRDAKKLIGLQIASVRYMTEEECAEFYIFRRRVVLGLSDGTTLYVMSDDEGNDAGALFAQLSDGKLTKLPTLDRFQRKRGPA